MGNETNFKFNISDFRQLLKEQNGKCYVTGRELTGSNCDAELIQPLNQNGKLVKSNICLIIDSIRELKRYHTTEEIYKIAKDIVAVYESKNKKK
jgi:hypothetical protein